MRDLDAAALRLGRACAVLLDEGTPDAAVRRAAFEAVTPGALRAAVARVEELARPEEGSPYVAELRERARRLQFLPALLRTVRFGAALLQRSPAWVASGRVEPGRAPSTTQGHPSCRSKRTPIAATTSRSRSTG